MRVRVVVGVMVDRVRCGVSEGRIVDENSHVGVDDEEAVEDSVVVSVVDSVVVSVVDSVVDSVAVMNE